MIRPRKTLRSGELTRDEKEAVRRQVFERDRGKCVDCGIPVIWESGFWSSMHLAHIKSRGAGGDWSMGNLKTNCMDCHLKSHNAGGKPCPKKPFIPPSKPTERTQNDPDSLPF